MSGITAGAAIALGIAGAATVGTTISGIMQGKKQNAIQEQALKSQRTAQDEATASALSTERKGELASNAANQKTPDIAAILSRAATAGKAGLSSTMLTGPSGVAPGSLNLGKTSLLGGGNG